jgi:precorrin-8X/cobalt-precorrin-8 methylmutase
MTGVPQPGAPAGNHLTDIGDADADADADAPGSVHPIEAESYRRLAARIDLSHLPPGPRAIIERVIHATADLEFADSLRLTDGAVEAGLAALRQGCPVVADVEMVLAGIRAVGAECFLAEARATTEPSGLTLSARAIELAAIRYPDGALFVVGCAPTALERLLDLVEGGRLRPALVVGVPVGFVGAAESKERLRSFATLPSISNVGERGGSAVAAAVVNALARLQTR